MAAGSSDAPARRRHDGYRILNGENDGFPGLILDRYADTFVLKLYCPVWIPHLRQLTHVIGEQFAPTTLVLRLARTMADQRLFGLTEGMALIGDAPTSPVLFHENGLMFEADVVHGQKTGHFLDQRENRALVGSMCAGMRVLDVFARHRRIRGVRRRRWGTRVTSVDQSEPTLAVAERNFAHNASLPNVRHCEHDAMIGDAYEVMDRLIQRRKHYDIVVVDPPAFAQRKSNIDRALHAYGQLTQRAVQLVRTDGLLVQASCSSRITEETVLRKRARLRATSWLRPRRGTSHRPRARSPGDLRPRRLPESAVRPSDTARVARVVGCDPAHM